MLRSRLPLLATRPGASFLLRSPASYRLPLVLFNQVKLNSTTAASSPSMQQPKENPNATVDVELPDVLKEKRRVRNSAILFAIAMALSLVGIIKYEDANAPVVSSTLYTLRRSQKARDILGNNISFSSLMPWVSGKLHAGKGVVDFSYTAIGEKNTATVHFEARKDPVTKRFVVLDWSFTTADGVSISLMDEDFHPFVPGSKEEPTSRRAFRTG